MRKLTSFIIAGMVLVVQAGGAWAVTLTRTYAVSATLPSSTLLAINQGQFNYDPVTGYPVAGVNWTDPGTTLAFGDLSYDPGLGLWKTLRGFAIEVANTGTTGAPDVQFAYTEGANPNGVGGHGLGYKVTLGFNKLVYNPAAPATPTHTLIYKKALRDSNVTVGSTLIDGGWLRVYLGVYVPPADSADAVPNAEPFTSNDAPGSYQGTLVVTATHV